MLTRRSSSDLSILKPSGGWTTTKEEEDEGGAVRVKLRIPKAELERLVKEGATELEATHKIASLFMAKHSHEEASKNALRLGHDEPAATIATDTRGVKSRLVSSFVSRFVFFFRVHIKIGIHMLEHTI